MSRASGFFFSIVAIGLQTIAFAETVSLPVAAPLNLTVVASPVSLAQCIQNTKQNNWDLKIARQELARSSALVKLSRSAFWPTLRLGVVSERYYSPTDNQPLADQAIDYNEFALNLDYNFLAGLRGLHTTAMYEAEFKAEQQKYLTLEQEILCTVETRYAQLQCLQAKRAILDHQLQTWQKHLERLQQAGTLSNVNTIDRFHLQTALTLTSQERMQLEQQWEQEQMGLAVLTGLAPETLVAEVGGSRRTPLLKTLDEYLKAGMNENPGLQRERLRIRAKLKARDAAASDYFPELKLNAKAGWSGRETIEKMVGGGVRLDWEFWSGGKTSQEIRAADAEKAGQEYTFEKVQALIQTDITLTYHKLEAFRIFIDQHVQVMETLPGIETNAGMLYREGRMTIMDILQTENDLKNIQFAYLEVTAEADAGYAWLMHYLPQTSGRVHELPEVE